MIGYRVYGLSSAFAEVLADFSRSPKGSCDTGNCVEPNMDKQAADYRSFAVRIVRDAQSLTEMIGYRVYGARGGTRTRTLF